MNGAAFRRVVGILVVLIAVAVGVFVWIALAASGVAIREVPREVSFLGVWNVLYDTQMPSVAIIAAAAVLAVVLAAGVALAELRVTNTYRRSDDDRGKPLAPKVVMSRTAGEYAGPVTVTVLVPAHNEESCLRATLDSLRAQSYRPERIVVVADNCTDRTVAIARSLGVEVVETVSNRRKKAGGLNQALAELLPEQGENDLVMVMDADTTLDQGFLEAAVRRMTEDRALMAIGGLFYGEEGAGLLGLFQRNEYTRYGREIRRRRGRVFVLTGTASIFRPRALRTVAASRGSGIPGVRGDVYDTVALTEDNELTIALKSLGALMISPAECTVVTEVMPTWKALAAQRLRWQRGALENLGSYGLTPQTSRYWAQQLGIGYGTVALTAYLALIVTMVLALDRFIWFPFWMGLGVVFAAERVLTVWKGGWPARLLALSLFPELYFATVLNVMFVKGAVDICRGQAAGWIHVVPSGAPGTTHGDAGLSVADRTREVA